MSCHISGLKKSWPGCMVHAPMEPHWRQPESLFSVSGGDSLMSQLVLCELMGLGLFPWEHSCPTSCLISDSSTGMAVLCFLQARNPGCFKPSSQWHCLSPGQFSSPGHWGGNRFETSCHYTPVRIRQIHYFFQGHLGYRGDWTLHHRVYMLWPVLWQFSLTWGWILTHPIFIS